MLCRNIGCGCAIQSSTLNVSGSGTPTDPWVLEQAEFTDLTALELAVDSLETAMSAAQADIVTLESGLAAVVADVSRLDVMTGGVVAQSGAGVGPTSGTTILSVVSTTVGPFPVAGVLLWAGNISYNKTAGTDTFSIFARLNAVSSSRFADRTQLTAGAGAAGSATSLAAATAATIDMAIGRDSGAGTATTVASTNAGRMYWWFLPT